jgi:hypothetical protein
LGPAQLFRPGRGGSTATLLWGFHATRSRLRRSASLADLADAVEKGWAETAKAIGIQEEYEGTRSEDFFIPLRQTLDDMIEESQPSPHKSEDIDVSETASSLTAVQRSRLRWSSI